MKRSAWMAASGLVVALTSCSGATATELPAAPPASVSAVVGSRVPAVHLSADAVARIGLSTAPARTGQVPTLGGGVTGPRLSIPYSAVIYDRDGTAWTYTVTGTRTYLRKPITVDWITGDVAVLSAGPAAGTQVVTVGSPELLGVEYDISGEE